MTKAVDYKKTTTTKLKMVGYVNCDFGKFITDEGEFDFEDLFKGFDEQEEVVFQIQTKEDTELKMDGADLDESDE